MTTKILGTTSFTDATLAEEPGGVRVTIADTTGIRVASVLLDQAEYLAAIATECDTIIIPRADLPKVDARGGVLVAELGDEERGAAAEARLDRDVPNSHAEWHRAKANAHLALAEHLDAHPPVDEAEVDALAALIRDTGARPGGADSIPIARRLLATGKVQVTA